MSPDTTDFKSFCQKNARKKVSYAVFGELVECLRVALARNHALETRLAALEHTSMKICRRLASGPRVHPRLGVHAWRLPVDCHGSDARAAWRGWGRLDARR